MEEQSRKDTRRKIQEIDGREKSMEQPNKIKHLELIQGTVTRMAQNSFWVNGVAVSLISALFVLCQNIDKWYIASLMLLIPFTSLLLLDVFFLQLERKYRTLYDIVRQKDEDAIDFDLKLTKECKSKSNSFGNCMLSKSILLFYIPLLLLSVAALVALYVGV